MSEFSTYRSQALHNQIINLEGELNKLKTRQNYATSDITSVPTNWIEASTYDYQISGAPNPLHEFAATFTFTGSIKDRMAIGIIESHPAVTSRFNQLIWRAFLPSDSPNVLKFGVIYIVQSNCNIRVRLHANMDGTLSMDRTYMVGM